MAFSLRETFHERLRSASVGFGSASVGFGSASVGFESASVGFGSLTGRIGDRLGCHGSLEGDRSLRNMGRHDILDKDEEQESLPHC
ncbi:MAG: hypothetical protein EA367_17825 [Leptolyngbya sp. DLM2.Bin15]|nr:MAG: hypothetical protein EA367_17825 [Leptolyngbya sp. DLM2.Bin15]